MLSNHFTLTKLHLGLLLMAVGVFGVLGILAVDILDVGREGGIGPAQQMALALAAALGLVGLTLIPLGGDPA